MYLILLVIVFAFIIWGAIKDWDVGGPLVFILFALSIAPFVSSVEHYHNLGIVRAQHYVIQVQQERLDLLETSFNKITSSDPKMALLNQDSPLASLVTSISQAQESLAKAKTKKAEAMVSIEQRKLGFFWFVPLMFPEAVNG